jgi:hypothetical protein
MRSPIHPMHRYSFAAAAAAALVLLAPHAAAAQQHDFPEVRPGQASEGSLGPDAPRTLNDQPFRVFQFQAKAGRRYAATMQSEAFDSYLVLARTNGGITETMKEDDDGGDGVDSRVRFTVPADGWYLLIARGFSTASAGAFRVGLEDAGEIVIPPAAPVRVGEMVEGTLSETDGFLDENERLYDLYRVRGEPGQDVHILMSSEAFDAYLEAGEMVGGRLRVDASNDDYEGRHSGVQVRLGRTGEAVVRATSLSGGQEGAYTLIVRDGRLPSRDGEEGAAMPVEASPAGRR